MRELITIIALIVLFQVDIIGENGSGFFYSGIVGVLRLALLVYLCMCVIERVCIPQKEGRLEFNGRYSYLIAQWEEEESQKAAVNAGQDNAALNSKSTAAQQCKKTEYGLDSVDMSD